jgi:hypothetical protein
VDVNSFSYLLQRWLPCFFPLLSLAGLMVCLSNRRLSPHMVLLILGFAGDLGFGLVRTLALTAPFLPPARLLLLFSVSIGGSLLSEILVVIGLAQVLADVRRRLARDRQTPGNPGALPRANMPDGEDLESWGARRQGSPHIQP